MAEEKDIELRLSVSPDAMTFKVTDLVNVNQSAEGVKLVFVQRYTGDNAEGPNATVLASIFMTWPHVIRLSNLLVSAIQKNKDKVIGIINDSYAAFEKTQK